MSNLTFASIATTVIRGTDLLQTAGRNILGQAPGIYLADGQAAALFANHPLLVAQSQNGVTYRAAPVSGLVSVELAGATGSGASNDQPAIAAAHDYCAAIGAVGVAFDSANYRLDPIPTTEVNFGQGPQPCYVVPPDAGEIDGRGTTFELTSGRGLVCGWWYAEGITDLPLADNVTAGSRTVTLEAGMAAQLALGDSVIWMLGDVSYDTAETYNWGIARVTEIAGESVTLDKQIPESFTLSPTLNNRHLRKTQIVRDLTISNLTLTTEQAESGVNVLGGERISITRVGARNLSGETIGLHYVDGATLTDCWAEGTRITQLSSGSAFSFAECRNIQLVRPRASGTRTMIRAEAGAEVHANGARFDNSLRDESGDSLTSQVTIFSSTGRSRISLHDTTVTGDGGYCMSAQSNGIAGEDGEIYFSGRTRLVHPIDPYQLPIAQMSGVLDMTIADVTEVYNLDHLRPYRRRFNLRNGQYLSTLGPSGLLVKARVYVSPGIAIGSGQQLQAFTIGRQGDNGSDIAQGAWGGLQAGVDKQLQIWGGTVGGIHWSDRDKPLQMVVATPAGNSLDNAGAFVEIEAWMAEPEGADWPVSEADWRSAGSDREVIEARFAAHDLPLIIAGAEATVEFAIPDMQASDFIEGVNIASSLSGLAIRSATAYSGIAKIVFENPTNSTIDKTPADIVIAFAHSSLGS